MEVRNADAVVLLLYGELKATPIAGSLLAIAEKR